MTSVATESDIFQTLGLARELETKNNNDLQLEDFLNLMVTELTYQDPFKPMDNSQLATQISQFATVSGIDQLNESFSNLSGALVSDQALQAANLVGRNVLLPSSQGYLDVGGSVSGVVGLESSASDVTVRITSSTGVLVREIKLGTQTEGEVNFTWDGLDQSGNAVAPGRYRIEASAQVGGEPIAPYLLVEARVGSVNLDNGGLSLNLDGLGTISLNDVAEIR
jgi:flagellar basal-body rod modification protein FlgD